MISSHVLSVLRALTAACIIGVVAMVASNTVQAQPGCCPTYSVVVQNTLPVACFPLTVTTRWSNFISGTSTHTAPGTVTVPAPVPPGCWLSPLTGLVINGTVIPLPAVIPPCIGPVNIGCANVTICFLRTATGCWGIVIS